MKKGATKIEIINSIGGRLDHSLYNLGLIKQRYNKDIPIIVRDTIQSLRFIRGPKKLRLYLPIGKHIAILGAPKGKIISSNGLKWDISKKTGFKDGLDLSFLGGSVCNIVKNNTIELDIEGDIFLVEPR